MLLACWLFTVLPPAHAEAPGGARLVPQVGHNAAPTSAVFSADDALLLTTSGDGAAIVWHTASGAILRRLEGHDDWVSAGAFSPDHARVATASNDDTVILWDTATGQRLHTLTGHADNVRAVTFTANGLRLASADDTGTVLVWDAASGALIHTLSGARRTAGIRPAITETRAATPNADGSVTTWDLATGKALATVSDDGDIATTVLSPSGAWLLTAGRGKDAKPTLWDAGTGQVLTRLQVHPNGVRSAAFSPDGSRIATIDEGGSGWLFLTKNGAKLASMPNSGTARIAVAFSDDGTQLVTTNGDGSITLWNPATGQGGPALRPPGDTWSTANRAAFSHDGTKVVIVSTNAVMWDTRHATLLSVLRSRTAGVWAVAASPSHGQIATASFDGRVGVWSARSGALQHRLENHGAGVDGVAWSPDGARLVSASLDQTAMVWSATTGQFERVLRGHAQAVRGATVSADGTRIVTGATDGLAIVWNAATGEEMKRFEGGGSWVVWTELTADHKRVSLGTLDGLVSTWDVTTGKRLSGFEVGNAIAYAASPDGKWLWSGGEAGPPAVWDRKTGKRLATLDAVDTGAVIAGAVSADGAVLAAVGEGQIVLWSTATWKPVRSLATDARGVTFSPDGKWLWTAHEDATARLWDVATGTERAALLSFADGTWAVVDPQGRFDASDDGDVDGLVWVIGGEPYALDQLRDHFYDPGLLAKILGTRQEALRSVPGLSGITPPPRVRVDGPDATGKVRLQLEDRGGGVGDVLVLLNGSDASAAVAASCGASLATGCTVNLSGLPTWVPGGQNRFEAYASVKSGDVRSRGTVREVVAAGQRNEDLPDLWVVAVGTGDYVGESIDLVYPPLDAAQFADAMTVAGTRAFGPDRTHVRVLTTSTEARPSVAALAELQAWLKASDPGDTVVLYLSGHGVSLADGTTDDYFYLMPEAGSLDDLRDPQLRAKSAWSGTQIAGMLSSVPALKRAVILDTCAAGKFDGALAAARDLSSDAVRAHARAQERTGAWFLAGAAADKVSYEASRYSQGLLTYALLEGMRGPALADGDVLFVAEWFRYAENQVPVYARGIGGVQQPITRQADGGDFLLGQLPEGDRSRVPLAMPKPVVVRAQVMTADGRPDRLGVAGAINQALRDAAAKPDATMVVWDSEPSEDTWQVTGQYREQGGGLKFSGYLTRSGAKGEEVSLALAAPTAEALAAAVVTQVVARVR